MAKKDDASKVRPGRPGKRAGTSPPFAASPGDDIARPNPLSYSPLMQAVEAERAQLLQAHSLLKCLHETLLYLDDENAVLHADVANIAARLIDESVTRLDFVRLAPMIESLARTAMPTRQDDVARPQEPSPPSGRGPDKVEDRPRDYKVEDAVEPRYLC